MSVFAPSIPAVSFKTRTLHSHPPPQIPGRQVGGIYCGLSAGSGHWPLLPLHGTHVVLTDAGPVEEGLEALRTDNVAIEIVVMAEVPGAATKFPIAHVFAPESDTAEAITTDSRNPYLVWEFSWEVLLVPFPYNGVWATSLHTKS